MGVPGYAGSILYVDLTSGRTRKEPLAPELIRTLIGGWGINNKLAYDLMPRGVDPLSPENLIIIGAGPFAGTLVPGAAKILATTRFPVNGAFATAAGGGSFALMLKSAGYDHAVISGRAGKPVYLRIAEDEVELCDATKLWGKDSFETIDTLRSRYEPCSVIPIGQAGENLVRMSITSVDKAGTLGRGGLPAVMGSKNLKAIVAQQGMVETTVAHRLNLQKLVNSLYERVMKWPGQKFIVENGLMVPPPDIAEFHRKTRKPLACPSCPLADKEVVTLCEGPYAGLQTYGPHVTINRFNASGSAEAYEQSIKYMDTLNRYGLCRMNFTSLLSTVVYLYREGVITKKDTGGIELKDDIDTALKLARMTAYREGFGDVLAEGLVGAARRIGRGAEEHIEHVKGQAIVYDPRLRSLGTMEFEQVTTPRGAHVAAAGSPSYEPGRPPTDFMRHGERMGIPEEALKRVVGPTSFNPGRYSRYSEDWYSLFNCLSLCNRAQVNRFYHVKTIADLYSAVTGINLTTAQLMEVSERAWTIGKLLNVREGFNRKDDKAPEAWFKPLVQEGKEYCITDYHDDSVLTREDVERILDDYYDERGYDKASGIPTRKKLKELGLEGMAEVLTQQSKG
ncbi:aldehyde ferredoxin oxidoreductase C-terminal domain-containing protein [Chloroflexota bacterium]